MLWALGGSGEQANKTLPFRSPVQWESGKQEINHKPIALSREEESPKAGGLPRWVGKVSAGGQHMHSDPAICKLGNIIQAERTAGTKALRQEGQQDQ